MSSTEHFACDQSTARVRLREDLRIRPMADAGDPHVIIEDSVAGAFYRLGAAEAMLARLLDGRRSIADAFAALCQHAPDCPLEESDALELVRWLITCQLATTDASIAPGRARERVRLSRRRRLLQWVNPLAVRIPLGFPDRALRQLQKPVGWLFSPVATALGVVWILAALILAATQADQLGRSAPYLFSAPTLWWIALSAIALKLVHELGHGLVCQRYGGQVGETGVLLVLFAPLAYVDVNSVWRLDSRWQRLHVALAGIYVEWLVAATAMVAWWWCDWPPFRHVAWSVMLTASVGTIVFNANPLMRFDGYFALTDALKRPNLWTDSQQHLARVARRIWLGQRPAMPRWSAAYRALVSSYGTLALAWRVLVCAGLLIAATRWLGLWGALLSLLALAVWLGGPLVRLAGLYRRATWRQRSRLTGLALAAAAALAMGLMHLPWPGGDSVAAVAHYASQTQVRPEVAGFVRGIHVEPGQKVHRGDLLVSLENRQLETEVAQLAQEIAQADLRIRQHTLKRQHAAAQAETARREALSRKHAEKQQQLGGLTLLAPRDGIVIRRRLGELRGTYVEAGQELLVIGDETAKELRVLISQPQFSRLADAAGTKLAFWPPGLDVRQTTLRRVQPRASVVVRYPALAVDQGGPLPVKPVSRSRDGADVEFLEPYFEAIAPLGPQPSRQLRSGQRVRARLGGVGHSVGRELWMRLRDLGN